ncbi:MAG: serine/threonine-protein kinase PknK [Deltaproteobacteria bacterium]|nr:MAG: serine/threonine-protein kinase PknK [Deltaproteobacteria bacterium]
MSPRPANLELPKEIGPYRVLRSIARGGSGQVFEVEDPISGEHLALKLLMNRRASYARFYREYEAASRLNHPNIIRVYHFGIVDGMPWQTMELVTGTPVQPYVMRKGRPGDPRRIDEAIRLAHDIAGALHHLHRRGLIHRDLKSANLLVLPDGRIKLIDFGSTRVLDGVRLTRDGDFVGTFAYASPEQLLGQRVDGRADLYSLGILLYRLCTGKRPFEHDDPNRLARMHLHDPPPSPRQLFPSIPEALDELILALLSKRPEDRPSSGKRVARALEKIAGRPLVLPGTLELEDSANRLVGREAQQEALRGFLDREEPGSLALIAGMEGAGRTSILRAAGSDASNRGWLVYRAVLSPGKDVVSIALVLRQILDALPDPSPPSIGQARVLLDLVSKGWDLRTAARREALQKAGTILLRAATTQTERPLVLLIEGLHHARPVVLDWLRDVKRALARTKTSVQFLVAIDPVQDRGHLKVRERFEEDLWVTLDALDAHQVGLLVGALLHRRPPPPMLATRIYEASGGLPVYVEDVVRALVEEGLLQEQLSDPNRLEWAQRQDMAIPVPDQAREAVLEAYRPLPALQRRALQALAYLDEQATVREVATGLGWSPQELSPVLASLRANGWIEPGGDHPDAALRWRQNLSRQVVRKICPPDRRRIIMELISRASALTRRSLAQVELLLETEQIGEAVESAIVQAQALLAEDRPLTALNLLTPVVQKVTGHHRIPMARLARLYLLHARALVIVRPLDPELRLSLKRAASFGRGDLFAAETSVTLATLQRRIGHLDNYRRHLSEAWKQARHVDPPPTTAIEIAVELGLSNLSAGDQERASQWFERAKQTAERRPEPRMLAFAEAGFAHLRLARGELRSAEAASLAALQLFEKAYDTAGLTLALPVWSQVMRHQGRFSESIDLLTRILPSLRPRENLSPYVTLLVALAWQEVELGRLGRAQECIDELAATVSSGEMLVLRLEARLAWGRILVASDQLRQATQVLGQVCNLATTARLPLIAEHARSLLAEALWLAGKDGEARELYHRALQRVLSTGDMPTLLDLCRSRARVAGRYADPDDLFEPVRELLIREPAELARAEWLIASAQHAREQKGQDGPLWHRARNLVRDMADQLTEIDRSALRVHPWARQIRQHLDDPESVIPERDLL